MKEKNSNIQVKYEFILEDYPFIKILRDNNRHFTYLSSDNNWKELIVKVAKTNESASVLRKEIYRIQAERWKDISWPQITYYWDNYFVAVKYNKTVGEMVDDFEENWDEKGLNKMFFEIVNWTSWISHEISNQDNVNIAQKEAKKRSVKYSWIILKHAVLQRVNSILWSWDEQRKIPEIPMWLIVKSCMAFLKYKPDLKSIAKNHACLHLDHLYEWDDNSWKYVAIDWEHSELQPYRYEYLDEAYIFQNLLQRHSENSAITFYKEFIKHRIFIFDSEKSKIRAIFIKKLLWWLFEILEDKINNPNPYEKINLHLKYLKWFFESKEISNL